MSLVRIFVLSLAIITASTFGTTSANAKSELVIGITQYPSTFHPNIDSMLAKSYVHGLVRRPITVMNADWETVCMLCAEYPTLENGGAVLEMTPDGKKASLSPTNYWTKPFGVMEHPSHLTM